MRLASFFYVNISKSLLRKQQSNESNFILYLLLFSINFILYIYIAFKAVLSTAGRGDNTMKKKTYNNVLKAAKLIMKKGYEEKESLEMAVKIFDEMEALNNGMSIEWRISKIIPKEERKEQYCM